MIPSPVVRCLLLILLFCIVIVSCNQPDTTKLLISSNAPAIPATGDSLVEGTIGEASTLIPILASACSTR